MAREEGGFEGIVLKTVPHLDQASIVKIFTEKGLLSFYYKKAKRKKSRDPFVHPFCKIEGIYVKKSSDLFLLKDCTVLDGHLALRSSFSQLKAAGFMVQCLLRSQIGPSPSKKLYDLFSAYLKKLPDFSDPEVLAKSFALKSLWQEGVLELSLDCCFCKEKASAFLEGQSVCKKHAKEKSFFFSFSEWQTLYVLTYAKSFSELKSLVLNPKMIAAIDALFD